MNSDGVSLPTTISQMGSVAKTQSRAQQQAQNVTPFKEQLDKQDELKLQRVKQTEAADHRRVEGDDHDAADKRQRRRRRREQKLLARDDDTAVDGATAPTADQDEDQETVGGLIDLRA